MTTCTKCSSQVAEQYCAACGHPAKLARIDNHYIYHEVLHLLHFEKGFFYTAKALMLRPGDSIRTFVDSDRARHMKPVAYLILTSLLFTLIAHFTHAEEQYNEQAKLQFGESSIKPIMHWVQTHYGYANIIMGMFIALWVKVLFRKSSYNFFEIAVLLCFVIGQGMLLLAVAALFVPLLPKQFFVVVLGIVPLAYPTWAIGQFFGKKKVGSYGKAFFAYMLGYVFFYITIVVVGLVTDQLVGKLAGH